MIAEYERYHGIVLRELIVRAPGPLLIEARGETGRVNSFCVNGRTCMYIKHSAKRLPPWQFSFNRESLSEIEVQAQGHSSLWLALVCGLDGVLALTADEFRSITAVKDDVARFIRVDRDRNTMYRVYGNAGKLRNAKARGVAAVIADAFRGAAQS